MPKPQLFRNMGLLGLLVGVSFFAANLYLGPGHRILANVCFGFAILGDMVFTVCAILWVYSSSWLREPERPQMPPLGGGAPQRPPGSPPGADNKPRPPQP